MTGKKHDVWQSTEYFNELVKVDKSWKEKLSSSNGTRTRDPYGLQNNWKNDVLLLPDKSWADIYNQLINMPSAWSF